MLTIYQEKEVDGLTDCTSSAAEIGKCFDCARPVHPKCLEVLYMCTHTTVQNHVVGLSAVAVCRHRTHHDERLVRGAIASTNMKSSGWQMRLSGDAAT